MMYGDATVVPYQLYTHCKKFTAILTFLESAGKGPDEEHR